MNYEPKILRRVGWLYGAIVFLSNLLANVIQEVIPSPIVTNESFLFWMQFLEERPKLGLITPMLFIVPTVFCVWYAYTNLGNRERAEKAVLNIPLVFSLSSAIGWGLNFLLELVVLLYVHVAYGTRVVEIALVSFMFSFFSIVTVFTTSYLLIDLVNRTYVLPRLFPDGHLAGIKGSRRPQFAMVLALCFVVMTLLPVAYLLWGMVAVQLNNGLPVHTGMIAMSAVFVVVSLVLTAALFRLVIRPLKKLTQAAGRIQDGDYATRVSLVSNDEIGVLADSFNDMSASLAEKEFMRDTFGKVVDPEVRDYLMEGSAVLDGETREITVLFCDIRGFTAMSEHMDASAVVSLLNRYFTALGSCIARNHGIINKYIGDAIMALFGAPVPDTCHAEHAVCAARDMRRALETLNAEFAAEGKPRMSFGIGIHTGPVFAGTIGAANRMEYTVIGDTVNTASRIESLCKTYVTDLLLSESTVTRLGMDGQQVPFVAESEIRGKDEKIRLYTVPTCGA